MSTDLPSSFMFVCQRWFTEQFYEVVSKIRFHSYHCCGFTFVQLSGDVLKNRSAGRRFRSQSYGDVCCP